MRAWVLGFGLAIALAGCQGPAGLATVAPLAPSAVALGAAPALGPSIRIEIGSPKAPYRLAMQIFIQRQGQPDLPLDVEASDTIDAIKAKIQDQTGLEPAAQRLAYGRLEDLEDGRSLSDYNIQKNSSLRLELLPSGVHRWVRADLFEYRLILRREASPGAWVELDPPVRLVVPVQPSLEGHRALFQKLRPGQRYQVELEAWGRRGGGAAELRLNQQVPSTAVFDFTAANDLQAEQGATLRATLDAVPFSGQGGLAVGETHDGSYQGPSTATSVSVDPPASAP